MTRPTHFDTIAERNAQSGAKLAVLNAMSAAYAEKVPYLLIDLSTGESWPIATKPEGEVAK